MEPILKWAGGKYLLLDHLKRVFSEYDFKDHTFFEPFVGGGSVFINLAHPKAVINDLNSELINMYQIIKSSPDELIDATYELFSHHSKEFYYEVRNMDRSDGYEHLPSIARASRMIYLNRTCFNGLTRYNSKGYFNVPMGTANGPQSDFTDRVRDLSAYLNEAYVKILNVDFEEAVKDAKEGDMIYFDPPYDYEKEGFTSYTSDGWSRDDLKRLKLTCDKLRNKGCHVVVSNHDTEFVNDLFSSYNIDHIEARRFINSNGKARAQRAKEVIIHA